MSTLPVTQNVARLVPLLGSDKPGEQLAAIAAIDRALRKVDLDWHDLAASINLPRAKAPQVEPVSARPEWQTLSENLLRLAAGVLRPAEHDFLVSMTTWPCPLSERQARWLAALEIALTGRRQ